MKYKIGDKLVCTCGNENCLPFTITSIDSRNVIHGLDINKEDCIYFEEDIPGLRYLTPLDELI